MSIGAAVVRHEGMETKVMPLSFAMIREMFTIGLCLGVMLAIMSMSAAPLP